MKIAVASDLHLEREPPGRPSAEWLALDAARRAVPGHPAVGPLLYALVGAVDLVVLAGDIAVSMDAFHYAEEVSRFVGAPVVIVLGNHEGDDGRDLDILVPEMRAAARATDGRVTFLENESAVFEVGGRRLHVLGCTLWTDFAVNGARPGEIAQAMNGARDGITDFERIHVRGRRLSPEAAQEMHLASRTWLGAEVARIRAADGEDADILVVTHHAPLPEACGPALVGGRKTPAFASDLTTEIAAWRPRAWVFGHTHFDLDTVVGATRVVSAQRGYLGVDPGAETFLLKVL